MDEHRHQGGFRPDPLFLAIITGLVAFGIYFVVIEPMSHRHARVTTPANACINNLRQIDAAANQFALEHNKTNGDAINFPADLTPYIKLTRDYKVPSCPSGGTYHISTVGEVPACSLSNTVNPPHVLP